MTVYPASATDLATARRAGLRLRLRRRLPSTRCRRQLQGPVRGPPAAPGVPPRQARPRHGHRRRAVHGRADDRRRDPGPWQGHRRHVHRRRRRRSRTAASTSTGSRPTARSPTWTPTTRTLTASTGPTSRPGTYRLRFSATTTGSPSGGTTPPPRPPPPRRPRAATDVTGIDAVLDDGATVTGTVTFPQRMSGWDSTVALYDAHRRLRRRRRGQRPHQRLLDHRLPPGTYRAEFARDSGYDVAEAQFYNGKAEHLGVGDLGDVHPRSRRHPDRASTRSWSRAAGSPVGCGTPRRTASPAAS